jgi:hypothetical protein
VLLYAIHIYDEMICDEAAGKETSLCWTFQACNIEAKEAVCVRVCVCVRANMLRFIPFFLHISIRIAHKIVQHDGMF